MSIQNDLLSVCPGILHCDLIIQQSMEKEFKQTSKWANKRAAGKSYHQGFHNSLLQLLSIKQHSLSTLTNMC